MGNYASKQTRQLNKSVKSIPKLDSNSNGNFIKHTVEEKTKEKIYTSRPTQAQENEYLGEVSKSRETFANRVKNMSNSSNFTVTQDKLNKHYDPNHSSLDFINNRRKNENEDSTKFIHSNELSNLIKSFKKQENEKDIIIFQQEKEQEQKQEQKENGNVKLLKELFDSGFIDLPSYRVSMDSTALNQCPVKDMNKNKDSKTNRIQIIKEDTDYSLSFEDQVKQSKQNMEEFEDLEEIVKDQVKQQHPQRRDEGPIHRKGKTSKDVKIFL